MSGQDSYDPKVQTHKIVKVPQLQVIDEVAKVPRSIQRQVPMIRNRIRSPRRRR